MNAPTPFGLNAQTYPCGCRVDGDGSLRAPLKIIFCPRHVVLNDIAELAPAAAGGHARHQAARARLRTAQGELLAAVLEEIRDAVPAMVGATGVWEITQGMEQILALAHPWPVPHPYDACACGHPREEHRATSGWHGCARGKGTDAECRCDDFHGPAGAKCGLASRDRSGPFWQSCTPEWAADRFGLRIILDAIADKLDECRGHAKAAAKFEKQIATVGAVVALLRREK